METEEESLSSPVSGNRCLLQQNPINALCFDQELIQAHKNHSSSSIEESVIRLLLPPLYMTMERHACTTLQRSCGCRERAAGREGRENRIGRRTEDEKTSLNNEARHADPDEDDPGTRRAGCSVCLPSKHHFLSRVFIQGSTENTSTVIANSSGAAAHQSIHIR